MKTEYKLSNIIKNNAKLIRDGSFYNLGLSNSNCPNDDGGGGGSFLSFLEDERYIDELNENNAITCVIAKSNFLCRISESIKGIALSETPRIDFFSIHNLLSNDSAYKLPDFKTSIGDNCTIGNYVDISPKNVAIGNNVTIESFVSIKGHCIIGNNTVIRSGCQIGGDGYEFKENQDSFYMVKHCGKTIIGNNVNIWSNCVVHKAVFPWDITMIDDNTNINGNVHIDHGTKIGKRCEICAGAILSGRSVINDYAYIGPGAILSNRITIGQKGRVSLGSVVTKDVGVDETVSGNFAVNHKLFIERLKKTTV